jgi:hypothetical protein
MVKQTVTALKMMPIPEAVSISFVAQAIDKDTGVFKATESQDRMAATMLDELSRWTASLATLRA